MHVYYNRDTGEIRFANTHLVVDNMDCGHIQVNSFPAPIHRCRVNLETLEIEPIPE